MADPKSLFLNRELSWLEFNQRVLEEALDPSNAPLERLKFLAITASNLDEFFMVRVGSLQIKQEENRNNPDPAGLTPHEQLAQIHHRVLQMVTAQQACMASIEEALAAGGVRRLSPEQLSPAQAQHVQSVFSHEIFPLLTPLAASEPAPFPVLPGLILCLAVRLQSQTEKQEIRTAFVPIPKNVSRLVMVESGKGMAFVLVEEVIRQHLALFFPGETILETAAFRISRNADMAAREDLAGDLLEEMRNVLTRRRDSDCVRLELSAGASAAMHQFLKHELDLHERDIYTISGPLALSGFFTLGVAPGDTTLRAPPWNPVPSPEVPAGESLFAILSRRDLLLYHPFDSFEPVQRLIQQAADDPDVLAIKQILYRTSRKSPLVAALARAAEQGKQVTAIVELKARFDEARNISWAEELEKSGVQVIYGIKGLKTHAKLCLILRREPNGIRRYMHFGTGNYNEITAGIYTDVSFLTANETLASDAALFFNTITGYAQPTKFQKIEAAPIGLRDRLLELIEGETARASQGQKAHIMAKLNSLVDPLLIKALYAASQAGVKIELIVRGICCLRPGVATLSNNISVISIVDRFLEHSRILYFENGGEPRVFISSADWMPRNLDRRIELLTPVEDHASRDKLFTILKTCLADTVKGWRLRPDGTYTRPPAKGSKAIRSQDTLYRAALSREAEAKTQPVVFQPYRPKEI
ncbi:MAG: polyphosphate kinase 1 [bacterium]